MIKLTFGQRRKLCEAWLDSGGLHGDLVLAVEAEVLRINGGGGEAHDDAKLQALGWQRISCPVCGADGARAAPQPQQAAPGAVLEGPRLIADEDMARLRWAEYVFGSVQHAIHSTESVSYSRALNDLRRAISSIEESLSAAPKPQGE